MIVYIITNTITSKMYVGITTKSLSYRWAQHKYDSKTKELPLYRAIRKYGINNFSIKIIEECESIKDLIEKEYYWIHILQTLNPDLGYNILPGGYSMQAGYTLSDETKKKMSKAKLGKRHFRYGKTLSEEHKRKISESNKGKQYSEESRKKMSIGRKGKIPSLKIRYTIKFLRTNELFFTDNLSKFCREHHLKTPASLSKTFSGALNKYKGWKIIKKERLED